MKRLAIGWAVGLAVCLNGCDDPQRPAPVAIASAAAAAAKSSAARPAAAPQKSRKTRVPMLRALRIGEGGRYFAELGPERQRVQIVLSTKEQPLAPRPVAAYYAVAELVAPGLVPPTRLAAVPLAELLDAAADSRTRSRLAEQARVLADGTVLATLIDAPAAPLKSVELGDLTEGRQAWKWESKLVVKEPPPEEQRALLASYQKLLAADYLVENLRRREVLLDERSHELVAIDDNDVFSARGREGAVSDALSRLSGHLSYSASLAAKLEKLDRSAALAALRSAPDGSLLVTPKQLDDVVDRKRALAKLFETRIRQRGREQALSLP